MSELRTFYRNPISPVQGCLCDAQAELPPALYAPGSLTLLWCLTLRWVIQPAGHPRASRKGTRTVTPECDSPDTNHLFRSCLPELTGVNIPRLPEDGSVDPASRQAPVVAQGRPGAVWNKSRGVPDLVLRKTSSGCCVRLTDKQERRLQAWNSPIYCGDRIIAVRVTVNGRYAAGAARPSRGH